MIDYRQPSAVASRAPELRERLRSWLASSAAVTTDDDARFSDDGETAGSAHPPDRLKPAAVLVLVIAHDTGPTVLFTQRTAHLSEHAGQISFPGGRVEPSDRDAEHTALREAAEETGIDAARVDVLGALPDYTTGTGYLITPVLGLIVPPIELIPDSFEVAECFEVPLDFLLDAGNHRAESALYKGRQRDYCAIPYQQRYIWGATAGMLVTLSRLAAQARRLSMPADSGG